MPNAKDTDISISFLHNCFAYDPATGEVRWKRRPDSSTGWNTKWAGKLAGTRGANGYVHIILTVEGRKRSVYRHRIAHALTVGAWPDHDIDHWDKDRSNDRWENLRAATNAQNGQNSEAKGYWLDKQTGKWRAGIRVNYRKYDLGRFDTEEAAREARRKAQVELHPFAKG